MSNSNHEESLTGFPPHAPAPGGGDDSIVAAAAGIGATPVNGGAAALEIMVDTFVVGWGWLMLTASVLAALESAAVA